VLGLCVFVSVIRKVCLVYNIDTYMLKLTYSQKQRNAAPTLVHVQTILYKYLSHPIGEPARKSAVRVNPSRDLNSAFTKLEALTNRGQRLNTYIYIYITFPFL